MRLLLKRRFSTDVFGDKTPIIYQMVTVLRSSNTFYDILNKNADDDGNDFVTFADDTTQKSFLL